MLFGPMGNKGFMVPWRCRVQEVLVIIAVPAGVAMMALTFVGVLGLAGQPVPAEPQRKP